MLLAGDVWGPRLRNTSSLAGAPVPGWRPWQPGPLRASVSASVQWGGPSAPRPGNPAPHRPAPPSCAASGAGLPRPRGTGQRAGLPAQGRDGTAARPPKNGRWRRAPVPADPGAPRSRAPSRGPKPAGLGTRGSPEQELRAERARRPPPTHAQCRCAARGRRPARLCKPGTAGRRGAGGAAGRVLSGDQEGSSRKPRAAPTSPGGGGGVPRARYLLGVSRFVNRSLLL